MTTSKGDCRLNKREFLTSAAVVGAAAAWPSASPAQPDTVANGIEGIETEDLLDPEFASADARGFMSDAIHLGEQSGYSTTPIHHSTNIDGIYQRGATNNPTLNAFEEKIRALEGGEAAVSATCGMAIISQTLYSLLRSGDRVVAHHTLYEHTHSLLRAYRDRFGVEVLLVDLNDLTGFRDALRAKETRMVYFEPYANPSMDVLDAPAIIRAAKEAGALSILDNSFLSPYLFQPLRYGADLVLHSATKYISGDGGAMGGVISGSRQLIGRIRSTITSMGGILRPFDAVLLLQGLRTLGIRMERCTATALQVARYLEGHPKVARVRYGGLPSWDGYHVGATYLRGFGGMMGVEWKDSRTEAVFRQRVKICRDEGSFGRTATLVRRRGDRYTRIAIGLEEPADLIADFEQALA
jgi:cystathionine beta-lyase/cystathionine gamma-synthase